MSTSPVDQIKTLHESPVAAIRQRQRDEQLLPLYQRLSPEEGHVVAQWAVARLERGEPAVDILLALACLVPGALQGVHQALLHHRIFDPALLYWHADEVTSTQLLHWTQTPSSERRSIVEALAWSAAPLAINAFRQAYASLYRPFSAVVLAAGWALSANGDQRYLFHEDCYRLRPPAQADAPVDDTTIIVGDQDENSCPWCHHPLTTMFDLNLRDPMLAFLNVEGDRLRIVTCEQCTAYTTIFTEVDRQGGARWSAANVEPTYRGEDDWLRWPRHRLELRERRRTPFEAEMRHMFVIKQGASQLGGMPTWEQDADYPSCPRCAQFMVFIGQLQNSDLFDSGEGMTYAFLCTGCRLAATLYQQT